MKKYLAYSLLILISTFSPLDAKDSGPLAIFITKRTLSGRITIIEDQNDIIKIFNYMQKQKMSSCVADYGVHIYHTKDSVEHKPIWLECCESKDTIFDNFLLEKIKNSKYGIADIELPVSNEPKHVYKLINNTSAYINYGDCDTARMQTMSIYYAKEGKIDRNKEWHLFVNETRIDTLAKIIDFEPDGCFFSAILYFDNFNLLAKTKEVIEDNKKFQIHKINVPMINKYSVIFPKEKGRDIDKYIKENVSVPYRIGNNKLNNGNE